MSKIRLDKFLADMLNKTRGQVKEFIRAGRVIVDGQTVKSGDIKIDIDTTEVLFDNSSLVYKKNVYFMLNKPSGVVSATSDKNEKTVIDLITEGSRKDLFPVGRLDKDTQGLLLITNDGELAHNLLSPKKHVDKTYFAFVTGEVNDDVVERFKNGIQLEKDFITKPARLEIVEDYLDKLYMNQQNVIKSDEKITGVLVTIHEGKFHQIKRMFKACNCEVVFLKRLSMGTLKLDDNLKPGEFRKLTDDEINQLLQQTNK